MSRVLFWTLVTVKSELFKVPLNFLGGQFNDNRLCIQSLGLWNLAIVKILNLYIILLCTQLYHSSNYLPRCSYHLLYSNICLENEPRVGTPIRRNLYFSHFFGPLVFYFLVLWIRSTGPARYLLIKLFAQA